LFPVKLSLFLFALVVFVKDDARSNELEAAEDDHGVDSTAQN
jgi:hypothetical protein